MPKFTAFIQAHNINGLALTLRAAQIAPDILVVHDGDGGAIERLCLRHRARYKQRVPGVTPGAYAMDAFHDWLLLLHPGDQLSEELKSAIEAWRKRKQDDSGGYLVRCQETPRPQLRFVNRSIVNWIGDAPPVPTSAGIFPGLVTREASLRAA